MFDFVFVIKASDQGHTSRYRIFRVGNVALVQVRTRAPFGDTDYMYEVLNADRIICLLLLYITL